MTKPLTIDPREAELIANADGFVAWCHRHKSAVLSRAKARKSAEAMSRRHGRPALLYAVRGTSQAVAAIYRPGRGWEG